MIITGEIDKYDDSYRIVRFITDENGKSVPIIDQPEIAGKEKFADKLYETKAMVAKKMIDAIIKGEISPIKLYQTIQNMNIRDLSARARISPGKVKRHMTLEGFKKATVEELQRYSKIFDVSVADFFEVLIIKNKSSVEIKHYNEKLIQEITLL